MAGFHLYSAWGNDTGRRTDLVKDLRRLKSRIKSHLLYYGKEIPGEYDNPNWSHAFVNWLMVVQWEYEAARVTVRKDPALQAHYRSHYGKNTKRIIVKVARRLLSRTLSVIKHKTPYQIGRIE